MLTKEQVLKKELELIDAIRSSDLAALESLLHDDLLFMVPGGKIITKGEDLSSHRSGQMVVHSLTPSFESVNIIDGTAVVNVIYETEGVMMGAPIAGKFRYIRVWRQSGHSLKVIAGAVNQL